MIAAYVLADSLWPCAFSLLVNSFVKHKKTAREFIARPTAELCEVQHVGLAALK
jgi:hypothetical protein